MWTPLEARYNLLEYKLVVSNGVASDQKDRKFEDKDVPKLRYLQGLSFRRCHPLPQISAPAYIS